MPLTDIFDETLDINATSDYILVLQAGYHELTFCILDTVRNRFIFLRSYTPDDKNRFSPDEVREKIEKDDFLVRKYRKIYIVLTSGIFTMVPVSLYDPGKKDLYFELNHGKKENITVLNNLIPEAESYILYEISTPLHEILKDNFPEAIFFHQTRPLFSYMDREMKKSPGNYFHVNVENDTFLIAFYSNHVFRYLNSFSYRNTSDIVYYVLNIIRATVPGEVQSILLSGNTERYDELNSLLSVYVKNIHFAEPSGNFTFSYVFNDTGLHRYLSLYTSVNCE